MKTRIIRPIDSGYPEGVREAPRVAPWCRGTPPTLHVRGMLPDGPAVAIVGSREATQSARTFAHELAAHLAANGWWIVSGGAAGIDTAAHLGALSVEGRTITVEAGGLNTRPFPKNNADLCARVTGRVSLEPDGVQRRQYMFLQRNVVMVSMTSATIVIHARAEGGAIQASRAARALGRAVLYVPEAPWSAPGGTLDALREGAAPLWCIEDARTVLAPFAITWPTDLNATERALWQATGYAPTHRDQLLDHTGLGHGQAASALLSLVLDGHLEEGPVGHYRRARPSRMRYGSSS